ncbi:MAG: phosphate ABC transporter ATP-binding protein PstB [Candidatus Odinarchaeia archaeon]
MAQIIKTKNTEIESTIKKEQKDVDNIIEIRNLNLWFGENHILKNISLGIKRNKITAIIGPSGCGKSTLIRTLNRLSELDNAKITGEIIYDSVNILDPRIDLTVLRKDIGMVFQKPNPFPKSIFENIAYGPKIHGVRSPKRFNRIVRNALEKAALWDEVKDRLKDNALDLSGGQQKRLCIARALAVEPEVLLLDEPCSALDPISTAKIEDLMFELKKDMTIIIVTHNMQQAARVSDYTAFLYLGELIEYGKTSKIFENPKQEKTKEYISGKFG